MSEIIFGIDYDGTWTLAPALFERFYEDAYEHRCRVVLVTQRGEEHNEEIRETVGEQIEIVNCPGVPKVLACELRDIHVDIWIEDNPLALTNGFTYTGKKKNDSNE